MGFFKGCLWEKGEGIGGWENDIWTVKWIVGSYHGNCYFIPMGWSMVAVSCHSEAHDYINNHSKFIAYKVAILFLESLSKYFIL